MSARARLLLIPSNRSVPSPSRLSQSAIGVDRLTLAVACCIDEALTIPPDSE